jgi:prepilin-type processing-associated H-X9-DG protein
MRKRAGLTRIDAAVALACVALVLAQAAVLNAGGRERAKREVCLANLRTLTAAWKMYADDNAGKLVNGGQAPSNISPPVTEPYWCTWQPTPVVQTAAYDWNFALSYEDRVEKMRQGALYKYVANVEIYRCPEADKNMHRSYIMPTSMNAWWQGGGAAGYPVSKVAKNTGQIVKPNERIVFLEEKRITPDAFQLPINFPTTGLCDRVDVVHGNGANFGFADGHAEYHQYECQSTIAWALGVPAPTDICFRDKDYRWLKNAAWGE